MGSGPEPPGPRAPPVTMRYFCNFLGVKVQTVPNANISEHIKFVANIYNFF